jgi:transcriptional regulator with XRE-family HTH domain
VNKILLARHSQVNRSMVYQWFNKKDLNAEIIYRIGRILDHDFSEEFPEYFEKKTNSLYHFRDDQLLSHNQNNVEIWKDKYIILLEKYVQLLSK